VFNGTVIILTPVLIIGRLSDVVKGVKGLRTGGTVVSSPSPSTPCLEQQTQQHGKEGVVEEIVVSAAEPGDITNVQEEEEEQVQVSVPSSQVRREFREIGVGSADETKMDQHIRNDPLHTSSSANGSGSQSRYN
jgi:YbbR domain-containing protein